MIYLKYDIHCQNALGMCFNQKHDPAIAQNTPKSQSEDGLGKYARPKLLIELLGD
jgi:hypothetical protein